MREDRAVGLGDQANNSNARSQAYWSTAIREFWQKSTAGIIETGTHLLEASNELERDIFNAMRLPFCRRTAQRLMAIAARPIFATHASRLPPSWMTLYELTRLPDQILLARLEDGTINPGMERRDARHFLAGQKRKLPSPSPICSRPGQSPLLRCAVFFSIESRRNSYSR